MMTSQACDDYRERLRAALPGIEGGRVPIGSAREPLLAALRGGLARLEDPSAPALTAEALDLLRLHTRSWFPYGLCVAFLLVDLRDADRVDLASSSRPFERIAGRVHRDPSGRLCVDGEVLPDGAWHAEPDRVAFSHAGLPCLLLRGNRGGNWVGYVGLPDAHPWAVDWANLDFDADLQRPRVHGGITWGAGSDDVRPADLSRHWIGFDCGHLGSGDLIPVLAASRGKRFGGAEIFGAAFGELTYRDLAYARAECASLAEQAARISR